MSKDKLFMGLFLAAVGVLSGFDMYSDLAEGGNLRHVMVESLVFLISITGVIMIILENKSLQAERKELKADLHKSNQDLDIWKKEAQTFLKGLGDSIDRQMSRWKLTPAEKEVGLLLLKGFSFKEIADIRNTSERTARQQSLDIYRKSGLSGRAEFSAFFLEDLLLPGGNGAIAEV
ncbi:transcriptional regulator, LuxR family [hydrothermal vent metagenome]|uniref:Transcriptional regulator, LuxR family n=1 Tax=hydrothermal vent metagenome TaxID=652676 RepID=A0A3B1C4G4_9ZZZZ